jgi:ABC-type amino acid transport system permease subunit
MAQNIATSKENFKMNMIINIGAFAILTILWLGFAAALIFNQALLDSTWQMLRGLPFIVQAVVWLLVLPVAAGLWIWETSWPLWLRLILVIGLGWVTVYTFFPRKA